jgi:hypothetical protein
MRSLHNVVSDLGSEHAYPLTTLHPINIATMAAIARTFCMKRDEVELCCKLKKEGSHENGLGGRFIQSERSVA